MGETVEYWKKVRGESKTDDVNPTGCRFEIIKLSFKIDLGFAFF